LRKETDKRRSRSQEGRRLIGIWLGTVRLGAECACRHAQGFITRGRAVPLDGYRSHRARGASASHGRQTLPESPVNFTPGSSQKRDKHALVATPSPATFQPSRRNRGRKLYHVPPDRCVETLLSHHKIVESSRTRHASTPICISSRPKDKHSDCRQGPSVQSPVFCRVEGAPNEASAWASVPTVQRPGSPRHGRGLRRDGLDRNDVERSCRASYSRRSVTRRRRLSVLLPRVRRPSPRRWQGCLSGRAA
jgi:hypothetical protein